MAGSKKKVIIFAAVFLVLLLIIAPVAAYFIANSQAKSNVAQFTKDFKEICDIKYGSVSYNILNRHLIVEDISLSCSSEKIADIKKAEFNHIVRSNPLPSNVQADITGGVLYNNASFFNEYGKAVYDMGFEKIYFQGRLTYTLGKASKEFNLVTLNILAKDFGLIQGEAKVLNAYDKDIKNIITNIKNNPASFYITFNDKGLKTKVFEKFAAVSGLNLDEVKTKTTNAIYKRSLNTDNLTKANYTQLEKFLLNGQGISLKQNIEDNISLSNTLNKLDFSGYRKLLSSFNGLQVEIIAK